MIVSLLCKRTFEMKILNSHFIKSEKVILNKSKRERERKLRRI